MRVVIEVPDDAGPELRLLLVQAAGLARSMQAGVLSPRSRRHWWGQVATAMLRAAEEVGDGIG